MGFLFQNIKIFDKHSPFHLTTCDILIEQGKISKISKKIIPAKEHKVIKLPNACVSPGWIDAHVNISDPGFEFKETLQETCSYAIRGGFTTVVVFPETTPQAHDKTLIEYILQNTKSFPVKVLPFGLLSFERQGRQMNPYYEMTKAGAIGFSDNKKPINDWGFLFRVLQYTSTFKPLFSFYPIEESLTFKQNVWESPFTLKLGFKGIPALAQVQAVSNLLRFAGLFDNHIELYGVVHPEALDLVKKAGLSNVFVSIPSYILSFDETYLQTFDPVFKTLPALISKDLIKNLKKYINEGIVRMVVSDHYAHNPEAKVCEWNFAAYGMHNLLTSFSYLIMSLGDDTHSIEKILDLIVYQPAAYLQLAPASITEGAEADLTFFAPSATYHLSEEHFTGESRNNPSFGKILQGKVLGVFTRKQWHPNI